MKMQILFDADTKEVIATVGTENDFVKNPYVLLDLGDKEPTFAWRDEKLVFVGVVKRRQ